MAKVVLSDGDEVDAQPRSLHCLTRRAENARKKETGHFGREDMVSCFWDNKLWRAVYSTRRAP